VPLFPPLRAGALLTIGVFFAVGFGTVAEASIDLSDVPLPFGGQVLARYVELPWERAFRRDGL
jgi:hypothetical protein